MLARPIDSEMVEERAPCSVKCSVVTNEIAAGCVTALLASFFDVELVVGESGTNLTD
jgi:hypothetical protein